MTSDLYPSDKIICSIPFDCRLLIRISKNGFPDTNAIGLGMFPIAGRNRVPSPPARIMASLIIYSFPFQKTVYREILKNNLVVIIYRLIVQHCEPS